MERMTYPVLERTVSRIALGCMHFGQGDQPLARARAALQAALEAGIDFFDHADIYARGQSETVFGQLMEELCIDRASLVLQSKCGIRFADDPSPGAPHRFDFSGEHIIRSVEGSLRRLRTDYLDILLLHRPDYLMDPEEVARTFERLHNSGKVRAFGVSNQTPAQMALLRPFLNSPLVANQVEFSLLKTSLLDTAMVSDGRSPTPGCAADGTLDFHRLHNIRTQAWAPLAYGYLSGRPPSDPLPEPYRAAAARVSSIILDWSKKRGCAPETTLLSWILRHPAGIQPIVGTRDPDRIRACAAASPDLISREDWYQLYLASRGRALP